MCERARARGMASDRARARASPLVIVSSSSSPPPPPPQQQQQLPGVLPSLLHFRRRRCIAESQQVHRCCLCKAKSLVRSASKAKWLICGGAKRNGWFGAVYCEIAGFAVVHGEIAGFVAAAALQSRISGLRRCGASDSLICYDMLCGAARRCMAETLDMLLQKWSKKKSDEMAEETVMRGVGGLRGEKQRCGGAKFLELARRRRAVSVWGIDP